MRGHICALDIFPRAFYLLMLALVNRFIEQELKDNYPRSDWALSKVTTMYALPLLVAVSYWENASMFNSFMFKCRVLLKTVVMGGGGW
jgi:hypothetical protein